MLPGITPTLFGISVPPGNDTNTYSLLHGDGVNGSTSIIDSGHMAAGRTWSPFNGAAVSTTQSKFGGASLAFNGTNTGIIASSSAAMANGSTDFTYDFWFYATVGVSRNFFGHLNVDGSNQSIQMLLNASNVLQAILFNSPNTNIIVTGTTTVALNTWYHAAFVRSGTTLQLYLNGTKDGAAQTFTGAVNTSPGSFIIGRPGDFNGQYYGGYIDEWRWSRIARWTANFTPPSAAYAP